jgi:biopolymer transport protein ExbD
MKKCSASHHHALAELNITPLLDLAFVLLVIFIITTTPVVNDLEISLPEAAKRPKEPKSKVHYVTVGNNGTIYLDRGPVDLSSLQAQVAALRVDDPDLNIVIRGAARAKYQNIVGVMDMLQQANVGKVNLATEAFAEVKTGKE